MNIKKIKHSTVILQPLEGLLLLSTIHCQQFTYPNANELTVLDYHTLDTNIYQQSIVMFSIRFILNILYTYVVTFQYNSHLEKY